LILEVAPHLPECTFTIAGVPPQIQLNVQSDNIIIIPPIPHHELAALFNTYEYYLQLSMAEGFPNALCEAMLCGCTPVVSDVFSMSEIVSDKKYILNKKDKTFFQNLLLSILKSGPLNAEQSRNKISSRYSLSIRKNRLKSVLENL
jgi:glycosyltransferase involved in cell wall biosynthesis